MTEVAAPRRRPRAGAPAPKKARKVAAKPAARPPVHKAEAAVEIRPENRPDTLPDTWIAQFIYAGADGDVRLSLMTIKAATADAARAIAAAHPPAEEFMVTVYPRSDEQFLDQVRLKALVAAGKRD